MTQHALALPHCTHIMRPLQGMDIGLDPFWTSSYIEAGERESSLSFILMPACTVQHGDIFLQPLLEVN